MENLLKMDEEENEINENSNGIDENQCLSKLWFLDIFQNWRSEDYIHTHTTAIPYWYILNTLFRHVDGVTLVCRFIVYNKRWLKIKANKKHYFCPFKHWSKIETKIVYSLIWILESTLSFNSFICILFVAKFVCELIMKCNRQNFHS